MTIQAFKTLRVGARVHIPDRGRPGKMLNTEVLDIDHVFNKVKVLLGRKPYSYRYVRNGVAPWEKAGMAVGMEPPDWYKRYI